MLDFRSNRRFNIAEKELSKLEDYVEEMTNFHLCQKIMENISRVIVGKQQPIELLLTALLADGHVLLEDIPGLGKTLIAKCLARSIGGSF